MTSHCSTTRTGCMLLPQLLLLALLRLGSTDNCYAHCKCTLLQQEPVAGSLSPQQQLLYNLRKQNLYAYVEIYQHRFRGLLPANDDESAREMTCVGLAGVPDVIPKDVKRLNMYGQKPTPQEGEQADQPGADYRFRPRGGGIEGDRYQLHSLHGRELEKAQQLEQLVIMSNDIKYLESNNLPSGNLTQLKLVGNGIVKVAPNALHGMIRLTELDLSANQISRLYRETFVGLRLLKDLKLSGNTIKALPEGIFKHLTNLETLDLSQNVIKELKPGVFNGLWNLKELRLENNVVSILNAGALSPLQSVLYICLRSNKLEDVQPTLLQQNRVLKKLDLSRNRIKKLDEKMFMNNRYLRLLYLDRNRLRILPARLLQALPYLSELRIAKNDIETLPLHLFVGRKDLEKLDISRNKLKRISPEHFSHLLKLQKLDLSYNRIRFLEPKSFIGLYSLRELYLNHNRIRLIKENSLQVHPRGFDSKITWLYLQNNRLRSIARGTLKGIRYVKYINLGHNRLNKLDGEEFFSTNHLHILLLNSNDIKALPAKMFYRCPMLSELSVASNRINRIEQDALAGLERLDTLDLTNNRLKQLGVNSFDSTPQLTQLKIADNYLEVLDLTLLDLLPKLTILETGMNNIQKIIPPSFYHAPLNYLSLSDNFITNIPHALEGVIGSTTKLVLERNPLHCDCRSRWLQSISLNRKTSLEEATCTSPGRLAGKKLKDLAAGELICDLKRPSPTHIRSPRVARSCSAQGTLITHYSERPQSREAQAWIAQLRGAKVSCHQAARISTDWLLLPAECARDAGSLYRASVQVYKGSTKELQTSTYVPDSVFPLSAEEAWPYRRSSPSLWLLHIRSPNAEPRYKYPCISVPSELSRARGVVVTWDSTRNKPDMYKLHGVRRCGQRHLCGESTARAHGKLHTGAPLLLLTGTGRWALVALCVDHKLNFDRTRVRWKFVAISNTAFTNLVHSQNIHMTT